MFLPIDFAQYFICVGHRQHRDKSHKVSAFGWQGENRFDLRVRLLQNAERKSIVGWCKPSAAMHAAGGARRDQEEDGDTRGS